MFERTFIAKWWRRRLRRIDREILFPFIRRTQKDSDCGYKAIRWYIEMDRAWRFPEEWQGKEPIENGGNP